MRRSCSGLGSGHMARTRAAARGVEQRRSRIEAAAAAAAATGPRIGAAAADVYNIQRARFAFPAFCFCGGLPLTRRPSSRTRAAASDGRFARPRCCRPVAACGSWWQAAGRLGVEGGKPATWRTARLRCAARIGWTVRVWPCSGRRPMAAGGDPLDPQQPTLAGAACAWQPACLPACPPAARVACDCRFRRMPTALLVPPAAATATARRTGPPPALPFDGRRPRPPATVRRHAAARRPPGPPATRRARRPHVGPGGRIPS